MTASDQARVTVSVAAPPEIAFEPREGGCVFENRGDGPVHEIGRVLTWQPPSRLRFAGGANADNSNLERPPDEAGRSSAVALGETFRQLHIPSRALIGLGPHAASRAKPEFRKLVIHDSHQWVNDAESLRVVALGSGDRAVGCVPPIAHWTVVAICAPHLSSWVFCRLDQSGAGFCGCQAIE